MLILNSGGTFNKRYNEETGVLEVPYDNDAIDEIMASVKHHYMLAGVVYKDSLDMDTEDRKRIASIIAESDEAEFVLVHGTDTMDETAEFLDTLFDDRVIVLTGAMKPYSIDRSEASFNLGMAIGFAEVQEIAGVYICMNGYVKPWQELKKNPAIGKFQVV
ncbi:asparaginase domain-containing protein [Sulfurimonas paralvinellae]|uniref:Asparaginase n=1 Tax=Sulfurimonas paralvinellae TaxID=317658 RepID=A0A7M1B8U3_9BACT|nr:asparaginase domain-containing protein [Sulfurimonas paralvinellae]QOP46137.1 asparaginase [Sulfurimonas paralvinellae]